MCRGKGGKLIPFPWALGPSEIRTALFRIWIWLVDSISYDDNRCVECASLRRGWVTCCSGLPRAIFCCVQLRFGIFCGKSSSQLYITLLLFSTTSAKKRDRLHRQLLIFHTSFAMSVPRSFRFRKTDWCHDLIDWSVLIAHQPLYGYFIPDGLYVHFCIFMFFLQRYSHSLSITNNF